MVNYGDMLSKRLIFEFCILLLLVTVWCMGLLLFSVWGWERFALGIGSIGLWIGLGLKRRGGLFLSTDSLLWGVAFLAVAPFSFFDMDIVSFGFLAMLVAWRAYMQWPGVLQVGVAGGITGALLLLDIQFSWVFLILLPTLLVGAGWRKTCLYWRWGYVLLYIVLVLAGALYGRQWPSLPPLPKSVLMELWHRSLMLCAGGAGIAAGGAVLFWSFFKPNRHFARTLALAFFGCLWGSLFFEGGGPFAGPVACLNLIMLAFVVGLLATVESRWILGHVILILLSFLTWQREMDRRVDVEPGLLEEIIINE